jgi:hypothetical protein
VLISASGDPSANLGILSSFGAVANVACLASTSERLACVMLGLGGGHNVSKLHVCQGLI